MIDLVRTLAVLAEPPAPEHGPLWEALGVAAPGGDEHTDLFVLQLFPYASVHLGPEGRLGGEARDRIAGFFRALGHAPVTEPDHLVFLLAAWAGLWEREEAATGAEERAAWARARDALLVEHLLPWLPSFVRRVADLAGPAYRAWAEALDELLRVEAGRSPTAAALLSTHLAEAPALPDPRGCEAGEFVEALLAPVRVGLVLTASDLARAAEDLGLGRRVGERRFVVRSLLEQDGPGLLAWLGAAAASESAAWEGHWLMSCPAGRWWHDRAAATAVVVDGSVHAVGCA